MVVLRPVADRAYALCVSRDGCANGGWVHLQERGGRPDAFGEWELQDGVLRAKANPRYALCITHSGCQNGGWVHMWEQGDEVDIYGQWIIQGGSLRAKADPGYVLCVRRDGRKDGGGLHMWSFDGAPDVYGQWEILDGGDDDLDTENPMAPLLATPPCSREASGHLLDGAENAADDGGGSAAPFDAGQNETETYTAEPGRASAPASGLLGPVLRHFEASLVLKQGEVTDIHGVSLLEGVDALARALDEMGWNMGHHLFAVNIRKLRKVQARSNEASYREWLLRDIPEHAVSGYAEYADNSACMANLWLAWTLEFFVHFFALLHAGQDTEMSIHAAYAQTLQGHHGFLQRHAFLAVVKQMPGRRQIFAVLEGGVKASDVVQEAGIFADHGRHIVRFCLQMNEQLLAQLKDERKGYEMDQAYGKA